ncbi:hypothetical protein Bca4012_025888 [Brassica carinata]
MSSREENIYKAKLADEAENYDDMVEFMEKVAKTAAELTPEERNFLSIAYKNLIAGRRVSLKRIRLVEKKETRIGNTDHVSVIKDHRVKIEITRFAIGDYHRYLSDSKTGAEKIKAVKRTLGVYKSAQAIALNDLPSTNVSRLGLALNLSLFYYETLISTKAAHALFDKT